MNDRVTPTSDNDSLGARQTRLSIPASAYDPIVFGILAAVGVVFVYGAFGLGDETKAVDASTVPMIAGSLLIALCLLGAIRTVMRREDTGEVVVERPFQILLTMILVLIFPPAIDLFGYYLTAAFWVPAFAWLAGARSWVICLFVGASVLAMARFVFEMLLGTPLP